MSYFGRETNNTEQPMAFFDTLDEAKADGPGPYYEFDSETHAGRQVTENSLGGNG